MSNLTKAEVAQALKHPLRRKLISVFVEHGLLSPKEAAGLIGASLNGVSYHVKVLVEYRFLALRATAQVRGAQKSLYFPNHELLNSAVVKEFLAQNP